MSSLPADQRKGYLLQPRPFLTFQTLVEAILEADGITREMLDRQRSQVQAISEMAQTVDDSLGLAALLGQYEKLIDEEFFAILVANIRSAEQAGDNETAAKMTRLREMLMERTPVGQEVARQEEALKAVLEGIDENLTREDLLDRIMRIEGDQTEQILGVLIAVARPLVDYQFFQLMTRRLDEAEQGGDQETAEQLKALRRDILELTQQLDAESRERMLEKGQLLTEILQSEDRRATIRSHLEEIDAAFLSILEANIAQSEQQQRNDVAGQLRAIRNLISEVLQEGAPPIVRLIERLLHAEYPDETRQMLKDNRSQVNADFLQRLEMYAQEFAERGEDETSEQLRRIKAQAELLS